MLLHLLKLPIVFLLSLEARLVLLRYKPFVVAVTGSVGKTSTKDAIAHVLMKTCRVRKSAKSFNSELGVPLTILGLDTGWRNPLMWLFNLLKGFFQIIYTSEYPEVLILEVGADHPGDIRRLTRWLKPDIAVVTLLPEFPVHVQYFSSPEAVRSEKAELVKALKPGGFFVANADDPFVLELKKLTKARVLTFGFSDGAEVEGSEFAIDYEAENGTEIPVGQSFSVSEGNAGYRVSMRGAIGIHLVYASLAAFAVGTARGLGMRHMVDEFATYVPPKGRMRILEGVAGSVVIDDSYNSSPVAAEAALKLLKEVSGKRKIALLGDMLELGKYSDAEHWRIGRIAGGFVDKLVTVGKQARLIAEAAKTAGLPEGNIRQFSDSDEAGKWLSREILSGDVVLAKGSQGSGENMIRMERAVGQILLHPEKDAKELVRQEKEWKAQYKR